MKTIHSASAAAVALVAIAAVAALSLGLVGARSETQEMAGHDFAAEDHPVGVGVVIAKAQRGGLDVFGVTIRRPVQYLRVAFTLPGMCDLSGVEQWPIADPDCEGPTGLAGSLAGSGRSATGQLIVVVEQQIKADCYEGVKLGMIWPIPTSLCKGAGVTAARVAVGLVSAILQTWKQEFSSSKMIRRSVRSRGWGSSMPVFPSTPPPTVKKHLCVSVTTGPILSSLT